VKIPLIKKYILKIIKMAPRIVEMNVNALLTKYFCGLAIVLHYFNNFHHLWIEQRCLHRFYISF